MLKIYLTLLPVPAIIDKMEREMYTDYDIGESLVTEELMLKVRDLLSSALPEDASDDMIEGFWEKVYDNL